MASSAALKQDEGADIPGEGEALEQTPRDFDTEAREHGWRPQDEFPGDPAKWVDAETFVKRADEVMPLLKAQHAKLKREFADFKRDARRMSAQIEGAEKRAFDKAKAELEQRIEVAIESGDLDAGKAALKEIDELKPVGEESPAKYSKEEAQEALDAFRENNSWFDRGNLGGATDLEMNARAMFERVVEKRARQMKMGEEPPPEEFFAACADEVFEKYPQLKGKAARIKPQSAVESGGTRLSGKKGNTFDDLPEGAKLVCNRLVAKGIITRENYVKTYDWSKP